MTGCSKDLYWETCAITIASTSHSAQVKGAVLANLKVFNNNYAKFKLGFMEKLSAEVILRISFMKLHSEVQFKMHDPQEAISINNPLNKPCKAMAAKIEPPKFFRSTVFLLIVFL